VISIVLPTVTIIPGAGVPSADGKNKSHGAQKLQKASALAAKYICFRFFGVGG